MKTMTNCRQSPGLAALAALLALTTGAVLAQSPVTYAIDADRSEVLWRVYRAGAFARFGHNHVISVPNPTGVIVLDDALGNSRVELGFRVDGLGVDDPALRARYGEEFSSEPSAEDISGTRSNMLGEAVLNAERFPEIRIVGTGLTGTGDNQSLRLHITLLGREIVTLVPIDIMIADDTILASGEFRLTHEALGMMPFSVMMGALQVAPEIDFTYRIHATRRD